MRVSAIADKWLHEAQDQGITEAKFAFTMHRRCAVAQRAMASLDDWRMETTQWLLDDLISASALYIVLVLYICPRHWKLT
jgi:hypothetical protein